MAIKEVQRDVFDQASLPCQIVAITEKVFFIVAKFRREKNRDIKAFRHVQDLLYRRARLLEKLREKDYNRFMHIIRKYNLSTKPNKVNDWRAYKYNLPKYAFGKRGNKFAKA